MATLFTEIYKQYGLLTDDSDIKNKYTRDYNYEILANRLNYAIGRFMDYCYKDLSNITPFQRISYNFTGDGINKIFTLNPASPIGSSFYVEIDGVEDTSFTFDNVENTITIGSIPKLNSDIYIGSYILNAQFNDTLNLQEIGILADGMIIAFEREKLDRTLLLNYMVYSKDYDGKSQANHIKEVKDTIDKKEKNLEDRIHKYMFKQNPNTKNLSGKFPKIII